MIDQQYVNLTWENITVRKKRTVWKNWKMCSEETTILQNVTGAAESTNLIAVMGPSGSGKTTLLGAISGRLKGGIQGNVKINGKILTDNSLKHVAGYVHQDDIFTDGLTVREHMTFTTTLKLKSKNYEGNNKLIDSLLIQLSLDQHQHGKINTLSGGERRRLALASELIDNPHVLFCDEPTSGIDSFGALQVVKTLETIARTGKIIIVTIHQPSSQLFNCFNNIILMSRGKLIFQGTNLELKEFFESSKLYVPYNYNPADFYIKCIVDNMIPPEKCKQITQKSDDIITNGKAVTKTHFEFEDVHTVNYRKPQSCFVSELYWLLWREFINLGRNFQYTKYVILFRTIEIVILLLCTSGVRPDKPDSVQNIQGILLLIVSELLFSTQYSVLDQFPGQEPIFLREKWIYSTPAYVISKLIASIPLCITHVLIFLTPYFIFTNILDGALLYFNMFAVLTVGTIVAISYGLFFSATFSNHQFAMLFIVPADLICIILSGIYLKISSLPVFLSYLKYISPFYYCFESMSIYKWSDITEVANCTRRDTLPCFSNGLEVLANYGFATTYDGVMYNIVGLMGLLTFFSFSTTIALIRKRHIRDAY